MWVFVKVRRVWDAKGKGLYKGLLAWEGIGCLGDIRTRK